MLLVAGGVGAIQNPLVEVLGGLARRLCDDILRSPKMISGEGCSHSVKVSERNLAPALLILGRVGLTPKRIYIMSSDGSYKEVLL